MYPHFPRRNSQRGFYLIGLLLVLCIIAILYGKQLFPDKAGPGMVTRIDQSRGTACMMNRTTITTNLTSWRINNANEIPTIEKLRAAGMSVPTCPDGGIIEIGADGTVYCSKHSPKPTPLPGAVAAPGFPVQPASFPPQPVAPAPTEPAMPPAE